MANDNLLLVGSMGHIGGAALDELVRTYPELQINAVVRSEKDLAILEKQYHHANVKVVIGSLKDIGLMESLSRDATIVLNCGPDVPNRPGIEALLRGQAAKVRETFYIGTSGADIIWDAPTGETEGRIWDDVANVDEIFALPNKSHIPTDRIVLEANTALLHSAIVSPGFVTGVSPSSTHPTPLTFPDWLYVVKALDSGVTISKGVNRISFVDVKELGRLYTALVGDALKRLQGGQYGTEEIAVWGPKSYYFGKNLEVSAREFMIVHLIPALKKYGAPYPSSEEVKEATTKTILRVIMERLGLAGDVNAERSNSYRADVLGVNMRITGTRATKALGFAWADGDAGIDEAVRAFLRR
ncbi:hypothetical protein BKA67DRAFT_656856 [Truncatella angustata]|uniref:Semialdehyde dehydrogenase NAD-binding domain-containing protein n=1 Tax=Truncatella angustata TaxID=152316 RepID=A0A9P8UUP4_9PEZI|nr:uncharacterized protein BKA67DRAFT_656856 [Truncatella angustata]KAH6658709.1 hypothetical protein BKA67DRAFT_656856 [Truncatella angustata]